MTKGTVIVQGCDNDIVWSQAAYTESACSLYTGICTGHKVLEGNNLLLFGFSGIGVCFEPDVIVIIQLCIEHSL